MLRALLASLVLALAASFSTADIVVPGADGSDGAFNPTGTSYVVDLSLASTGQWDSAPTVAGNGVYDPEKWAVVFKYSSVNVPAGCTVTFKNHPSRAPVVWLVNGTVSIAGTVSLNGKSGLSNGTLVEPGPGGFRGGFGPQAGLGSSPGFGPGGGNSYNPGYYDYANGSYAVAGSRYPASVIAVTYGDPLVSQLIGGSGGAGKAGGTVGTVGSGGSGGGALLIAASGFVSVAGQLTADAIISYGSYAAGGAIKIVADAIDIAGKISAVGADGLLTGRVRLRANTVAAGGTVSPVASVDTATLTQADVWPAASRPRIDVVSLGGQAVGTDPRASMSIGETDLAFTGAGSQHIVVHASNVPAEWIVKARVISRGANAQFVDLAMTSGDVSSSTWEGDVNLPEGITAIQVRAAKP